MTIRELLGPDADAEAFVHRLGTRCRRVAGVAASIAAWYPGATLENVTS